MPPLGLCMRESSLGTNIGSSRVCGSSYSNCALIQGLAVDQMVLFLLQRLGGTLTQWYVLYALYSFKCEVLHVCILQIGYCSDGICIFQGHPEWKKLQTGWPIYLDELDRMFMGVAVDGSTSYIPGDENPLDDIPSDEEEDSEEDHDLHTPHSIGSKRTSNSSQSLRSTASSPNKKMKSPAVRAMVSQLQLHNDIQTQRNVAMEGFICKRQEEKQADESKLEKHLDTIMDAARACGVTDDNAQLWVGVLKIAKDKAASYFFLRSMPPGRKALIEDYSRVVD